MDLNFVYGPFKRFEIPISKDEFKYLTYEFGSLNYIRDFIDFESYESLMPM